MQDVVCEFAHAHTKEGGVFVMTVSSSQNENDRTMMRGYRRVAVVEEFSEILSQIHNKDCLHAGMKKTFARVYTLRIVTLVHCKC